MINSPVAFSEAEPRLLAFVEQYEGAVETYLSGHMDADSFRTIRIRHGVHSQRPPSDRFMVRAKAPYGLLTSHQLRRLAALTTYSDGSLHITSRECVEYHGVRLEDTSKILRAWMADGLSTRESGGNSLRNVSACSMAGVCPHQAFDPLPAVRDLVRDTIGSDVIKMLPKKLKVGISACAFDCGMARIHDIGFVGMIRNGVSGFRVYVGGGIGALPVEGVWLAEFVPVGQLTPFVIAIAKVFDRLGDRRHRERARTKFLIREMGVDHFRATIRRELDDNVDRAITWGSAQQNHGVQGVDALPSWDTGLAFSDVSPRWLKKCVLRQNEDGKVSVLMNPRGGDLTAQEAQYIAELADACGDGTISITQGQAIFLRNVKTQDVQNLYRESVQKGLVTPENSDVVKVVSCPGAEVCNLGLTRSRDLAQQMREVFQAEPDDFRDEFGEFGFGIRVNGCPHSCCHMRIAPIGFMGSTIQHNGQAVPMYSLLLGGSALSESVQWGTLIVRFPARKVPDAVRRLLQAYRTDRQPPETFREWSARRFGLPVVANAVTSADKARLRKLREAYARELFADLIDLTSESAWDLTHDWGESQDYSWFVGRAECDNGPELEEPEVEAGTAATALPVNEVSAQDLQTWLTGDNHPVLLDVRATQEYQHGHIKGATWVAGEQLEAAARAAQAVGRQTVLICRTGHRSSEACRTLQEKGLTEVYSLAGGILDWTGEWA